MNPIVAQSGANAQIVYTRLFYPQGLTVEQLSEATGLSPGTTYVRLRELFNNQIVEELRTYSARVYRLRGEEKRPDIAVDIEPSGSVSNDPRGSR